MICNQLSDCLKKIKSDDAECPCRDENQYRKCIRFHDSRRFLVCEERNSKYSLDMEKTIIESVGYCVDGGVIDAKEHILRCDYAFYLKDSEKRLVLIELKGSDSSHALDQLSAMLDWDQIKKAVITKATGKLYGRIVSTRPVPDIYRNKRKALQTQFIHYGGNLKIMTRNGQETYQELCTDAGTK